MNHVITPPGIFIFYHRVVCLLALLFFVTDGVAQEKQLVQIKTFDQQLQPYKNVEVSVNGKEFIAIGAKGSAFAELAESDLPPKTVRFKDEQLEAASWNYSKGVLEVIIRKKSYQLTQLVVQGIDQKPLANVKVVFHGRKTITATTNAQGRFELPTTIDEKPASADQFTAIDYKSVKLQQVGGEYILTLEPVKPIVQEQPVTSAATQTETTQTFKDFDLSKLDSIQSITVFYAIFKNYEISSMSEQAKRRIDAKFNQLVRQLQDSVVRTEVPIIGKISDSSFVSDDIKTLLDQAKLESRTLEAQRADFDAKIKLINDKLAEGMENLDPAMRAKLLSDLALLERLLTDNENRFYKNQNDYRQIINSLKEKYFDFANLENKLSESEAQRLEEQRIFRQRLFSITAVVIVFAILIILLIRFSARLRKQKKELERVNGEIKRINENLEAIVYERTKLLEEANRELDTFLYRASHDLRSPVCSIIGLCNIALHLSDGESRELVQRVASTTNNMDKLLKKLSIISEINQPTNFSTITLRHTAEHARAELTHIIHEHQTEVAIDCPEDLVLNSYPNLVEVILVNLVENALFYSVLRDPVHARVEIRIAMQKDHIEMSVYDNGIGIEHNIRHRLYDMFFKGNVHSKGNGLGLYIVQKSVQVLDGKITVESEPGRYTKFTVRLPLKPMPAGKQLVERTREVSEVA